MLTVNEAADLAAVAKVLSIPSATALAAMQPPMQAAGLARLLNSWHFAVRLMQS
ncbi:MAG: hypothetical protein ACYCZY_11250 [Lacisediminihabitans sp.]